MARALRRTHAAMLSAALAAAVVVGCTPAPPGPLPLEQQQIDAVFAANGGAVGELTVGEALALAPEGTIGMIDARVAAGVGSAQSVIDGAPGPEFAQWVVVGLCGYPQAVPSVELAAVPPEDVEAIVPGWNLVCDGVGDDGEGDGLS